MARRPSTHLTPERERIARMIGTFELKDIPAFTTDLVVSLGLAGESSLMPTLKRMEQSGFINIHGKGRGHASVVQLTPRGRFSVGLNGLPVLGSIPAGPLEEVIAEAESFFDQRELVPSRPGDFLLRVKGDSMTGDGIVPGDLVLLRPDVQLESGEIAATLVGEDQEATLKRVLFQPGGRRQVTLRASNRKYPDRNVDADDVKIAGVFRGLIRRNALSRSK